MNGLYFRVGILALVGSSAMFGSTVRGVLETIYCDDEMHNVQPNETWTATVTTLNTIVANGAISTGVEFKNLTNATSPYQKAAWLIYQFASHAQADWGGIQKAIWDLFLQKNSTGNPNDPTTDAYWLSVYGNTAKGYVALTQEQRSDVVILAPVAGSQNPFADGMPQEFFKITPEPRTYALFGAGLILLAMGTYRRRKRS